MCYRRRKKDDLIPFKDVTAMASVPITTDVVSTNLDQGEVYNIM
jgi:hypothetical protein